jgi:hypothetical protein
MFELEVRVVLIGQTFTVVQLSAHCIHAVIAKVSSDTM